MTSQLQATDVDQEIASDDLDALEALASVDLLPDRCDRTDVHIQTQALAKRERLISAQILVPHPYNVFQLWDVLTGYECLADFIPNLVVSHCLPHPEGGIRLEQVGMQRLMKLKFKARVVLDLIEHQPHRIDFSLVEGDFQQFMGYWALESTDPGVILSYQVKVIPKRTLPIQLIENRICQDLPLNLLAIRDRVQALHPA